VAGSERSDGPELDIQGHRCALTLPPTCKPGSYSSSSPYPGEAAAGAAGQGSLLRAAGMLFALAARADKKDRTTPTFRTFRPSHVSAPSAVAAVC